MNFFKDAAEHLGAVDHKLIRTGILARGEVVSVHENAISVGEDSYTRSGGSTVCTVTVTVSGVPGLAPYQASFLAPIPDDQIGMLELAGTAVAVRVDPKDPQNIALDAQTDAPPATSAAASSVIPPDAATSNGQPVMVKSDDGTSEAVTTNVGAYTADGVIANGAPCTVTVLSIIPIDQKDAKGRDVLGMILAVHRPGIPDAQAEIGTHVPPELLSKVTVGATLPAKFMPTFDSGDNSVMPDWPSIKP